MKVAIQGIAGAFHDEAARKFFGDSISLDECDSFGRLCERVDDGSADYGVMAIENTIAGSLLQNYGYLDRFKLRIIGEIYLRIKMNLMALKGTEIKDIKQVFSHPIALRQCAEYLSSLSSNIIISEAEDTAESAKNIFEKNLVGTAAVAGDNAAKMYNLEILQKEIETVKQNYTRFIVLSKNPQPIPNSNKASVSFEVRHQAGSLADALAIFARNRVNLTKIQSVPIIGQPYQYAFHVDLEWDNAEGYNRSVSEVLRHVSGLSIYGEYRKGEIPGL